MKRKITTLALTATMVVLLGMQKLSASTMLNSWKIIANNIILVDEVSGDTVDINSYYNRAELYFSTWSSGRIFIDVLLINDSSASKYQYSLDKVVSIVEIGSIEITSFVGLSLIEVGDSTNKDFEANAILFQDNFYTDNESGSLSCERIFIWIIKNQHSITFTDIKMDNEFDITDPYEFEACIDISYALYNNNPTKK